MNKTFLIATAFAQDLSILFALFVFIIIPKERRKEFLLLGLALLIGFSTDALVAISHFIFHRSGNAINSIGSLLATVVYLLFYRSQFKSKQIQLFIMLYLLVDIIFSLVNMFFIQGISSITSYSFILRTPAFIIITLLYFYALIKELPAERISKLPMFWINTSFLLYYAGTFFQWLMVDYLLNVLKGDIVNTYTIKNGIGVVHYSLIAIGLWYNRALSLPGSTGARAEATLK